LKKYYLWLGLLLLTLGVLGCQKQVLLKEEKLETTETNETKVTRRKPVHFHNDIINTVLGSGKKQENKTWKTWGYVQKKTTETNDAEENSEHKRDSFSIQNIPVQNEIIVSGTLKQQEHKNALYSFTEKKARKTIETFLEKHISYLKQIEGVGIQCQNNITFCSHYAVIDTSVCLDISNTQYDKQYDDSSFLPETATAVYDLYLKQETELSDLFYYGADFMPILNDSIYREIKNKLQGGMNEFEIIKRPFQGLRYHDLQFALRNQLGEQLYPFLELRVSPKNDYLSDDFMVLIELQELAPMLSFDLDDLSDVIETQKALYTMHNFLQYIPYGETTDYGKNFLIKVNHCPFPETAETINATLQNLYQEKMSFASQLSNGIVRVSLPNTIGRFCTLTLTVYEDAGEQEDSREFSEKVVFDLLDGKRLTVRDVISKDSLESLTPEQMNCLDSYDFSITRNGNIECGQIVFPAEVFDFDGFSCLECQENME